MSHIFTKIEKAGSGSPKVLIVNCIIVLIAVVSVVVFLRRDGAGPHQEGPQGDTTRETEPKTLQPEERGDRQPEAGDVATNSIGMKLVYIPAGSFMMGSPFHSSDEGPQHQVRISRGFWMGQTEVTQDQYKSVMNVEPWSGEDYVQEDANNPAVYVSWDDAVKFCRTLSWQEGETYRLPTEAEWEYACRAGTTTRFSFGDSDSSIGDYAWFDYNTRNVGEEYAHQVGQKRPNPWGLYDMHGNVWEWCSDWCGEGYYSNSPLDDPIGPSSGETRCLRGGSWYYAEHALRCSYRYDLDPNDRRGNVGFRVVRSQS